MMKQADFKNYIEINIQSTLDYIRQLLDGGYIDHIIYTKLICSLLDCNGMETGRMNELYEEYMEEVWY